ncbi:MAG: hypothetical protein P9E24_01715 [Candidatus Competibacter sp.]|nr:hypothetical protein [Candidatus Competibacter sp.]MDG4584941.1 hypothetical protein [Candidatus Competibacter sp.]
MNTQGMVGVVTASLGLVLSLGASPPVEAGQWVVIAAEQSSLRKGALLDSKQPVKLAEGAQLTLLAEDGKTLKLIGPYSGVPDSGGSKGEESSNLEAISRLLRGHRESASTLGVMRGGSSLGVMRGGGLRDASTTNLINVDHSGDHCLTGETVVLWRGGIAHSEQVTLLADAHGTPPLASFTWPASEARWPLSSGSFEDGKSYLLQRSGQSIRLRIHKRMEPAANPAALAGWMANNGCKAQALSVLATLAEGE